MLRAVQYSLTEAAASLRRGRRSAVLATLTIAAGVFVLGFFLVVNANLRPLLLRWTEAAELSIYLRDDASGEQLKAIEEQVRRAEVAAGWQYVSKADAALRFSHDFPDLARTASQLEENPFPASLEVRLRSAARGAASVDTLAAALAGAPGVADVRYDRRLLTWLNAAIRTLNGAGAVMAVLLGVAAALTVANVVRVAADSRRAEIEIMQLVGAPLVYVRGPLVAEGMIQGAVGAVLAVLTLWGGVIAGRARFGQAAPEALGVADIAFLSPQHSLMLVLAGMLLGCMAGLLVARGVR